MICHLGIVELNEEADPHGQVERVYREGYRERRQLPEGIRIHGDSKRVQFIGVWDTVGALGIPDDKALLDWLDDPDRYRFHDTALSDRVAHARHAVATTRNGGASLPPFGTSRTTANGSSKSGFLVSTPMSAAGTANRGSRMARSRG